MSKRRSSKSNYTPVSPNATAVNILRSWLTAVGIPIRTSKKIGFDLCLTTATGTEIEVQVLREDEPRSCHGGIQVLAADITGRSPEVAQAAFHHVTDAAGYSRQSPLNRGAQAQLNDNGNIRKLHYTNEDFLVAIRHTQFRRSPNPNDDRWEKYREVIERTSDNCYRSNLQLCLRNGLTVDDIKTYARCLVVNFCAAFEIPEAETTFHDNLRKCYEYLKQNLYLDKASSLRAILRKKERSTLPDAETVSISLYNRVDADLEVSPNSEADDFDYDYISRHCELDLSSVDARKKSAAKKLTELLEALPHTQMVELLVSTSINTRFDCTTQREAGRRLKRHQRECRLGCNPGDLGVEEDKNLAGNDTLGAEE